MAKVTNGRRLPNIILAGDFNLHSIDWENHEVRSPAQYGTEINQMALDVMNCMFLTQMVKEPTRGSNILDLIFASPPDLVKNAKIRPGIGDHHSVTAKVQLRAKMSKKTTRTVFMYDKADETELKCEIVVMRQGFLSTFSLRTANENW